MRLHHVGYLVREIGPAAATYVERYGYQAVTGVVHDPLQTALVQFLRLPGDSSYLELIAPDGHASRLSAEAARVARPLHHLCYVCVETLETAAARLCEQGMVQIAGPRPAEAFGGRRICWLMGGDRLPVELVEAREGADLCEPGGEDPLIAMRP